jgi:hypothetical protein
MKELDHFPYEGVVTLVDKISICVKRLHAYCKNGYIGDVLANHLSMEIATQKDLYNFLISDMANSVLEFFGISVKDGVIMYDKVSINLIAPIEDLNENTMLE